MHYYLVAILGSPLEPLTYHDEEKLQKGCLVTVRLHGRSKKGVVVEEVKRPAFATLPIDAHTPFYFSPKQLQTARFIASYYFTSLGDALGVMTPFSEEVKRCEAFYHDNIDIELSAKQLDALRFLKRHKTALLFGDTGSGKTEIYMRYFAEILQKGKQAIFLLPEISLTPQMQKRLERHFGEAVVVWHSKLTKSQKDKARQKLYTKEARIVACPRSALFLPVYDLGLIVVDEEHDESYKSNSRPRYNARDMAIYMGKLYDIPVVLGSATPTLTTYEKFPRFRLKGRHFATSHRFTYEHAPESITPLVLDKLQERFEKKEQSIVFLPTRANFKYLLCADCGEGFECAFCNVGMSLHLKIRALKCHYCGFTQPIPQICPKCGSTHLVTSRLGTAEALKQLQEALPNAVVEQFDRDTITTQNKLKKVLQRFNDKKIDILVGTQMLSKGHDYHEVTLAVVLGLDNMLGLPDYRARERALSTLIQIAGRSGRKKDAEVVVQTYNEEFFSAFVEDYDAFLEEEKFYREGLYPPYKKLCRVLFAHKNAHKAKEAMERMRKALEAYSALVEVVGSGECSIAKVAGRYRYEILLRSERSTHILKALRATKVDLAEIDMDPLEFS